MQRELERSNRELVKAALEALTVLSAAAASGQAVSRDRWREVNAKGRAALDALEP